ncbi:heterokaryon incompatibility protein-domain-containing protein [Chaetomidium leptoderma]|uniref:Heterokaryon incompatibility protein-domain-containing protein n=1 Tax=Chaetomidium leptoderma TaxID=669021 RepID=A0AAN6ZZE8_9PEZI|nr:heterokaryon incompatibility protein-domain-containing protein [Chaetomidium leptoderma]
MGSFCHSGRLGSVRMPEAGPSLRYGVLLARWTGSIWIDALCINQADTAEKNAQVPLMSRIYRQAEQVPIWLGPENDRGGLHAIRELGVLFREQVREAQGGGLAVGGWVEGFVRTGEEGARQQSRVGFDFEAIWRVFRARSWWRRVWIIQEVALARKAVVLCGADPAVVAASVPWEDVSECVRLFEWMLLYPSTAPQYRRLYELLGDLYPSVSHLALASDGYRRALEEAKGVGEPDDDEAGMPLLDTMLWTSLATDAGGAIQATDPRDRIYGLLGMRTPGNLPSKVQEQLPSWVPDWTASRMIPQIGGVHFDKDDGTRSKGNASKGAKWQDRAPRSWVKDVVYEQPVISLAGVVVGRVDRVGQEFNTAPGAPDYLDDCRDWLLEIGNSALEKEICRFIHRFDVLTGKLPPRQSWTVRPREEIGMQSESWDYRRVWKLYHRCAFVDDGGRPGLGPQDTAPGDCAAVFAGGHVPFILREAHGDGRPTYVLGLLDGEGVTDMGSSSFDDIQLI